MESSSAKSCRLTVRSSTTASKTKSADAAAARSVVPVILPMISSTVPETSPFSTNFPTDQQTDLSPFSMSSPVRSRIVRYLIPRLRADLSDPASHQSGAGNKDFRDHRLNSLARAARLQPCSLYNRC